MERLIENTMYDSRWLLAPITFVLSALGMAWVDRLNLKKH